MLAIDEDSVSLVSIVITFAPLRCAFFIGIPNILYSSVILAFNSMIVSVFSIFQISFVAPAKPILLIKGTIDTDELSVSLKILFVLR